jgi:hypothetical protein
VSKTFAKQTGITVRPVEYSVRLADDKTTEVAGEAIVYVQLGAFHKPVKCYVMDMLYEVDLIIAIFRVCRRCAERGPGRDCPPRMRCRRSRPQVGHPFQGPLMPPLGPGGSRIEAQEPVPVEKHPDRQHISPGPERLGSSKCRSALTKPESGRRFVPGGRFIPVMDAGGRNYRRWMPGTKLELPGRKLV